MRSIARKLPQPEHIQNEESVNQFSNNFYLLFFALEQEKQSDKTEGDSILIKTYLRKMEDLYKKEWQKFLLENTELILQINELLSQRKIFSELMSRYKILLTDSKTFELSDQISEEINLVGISNSIWNKLNPLLERAAKGMKQCGIDPEKFYS